MNIPTIEDIKKALQIPEIPQDRDSLGRIIHRKADNLPKTVKSPTKGKGKWH